MTEYFFDSYAIIEVTKRNLSYEKYLDFEIRMSFLNLVEVTYILNLEQGEKATEKVYSKFKEFVVEIPEKIVLEAVKFRLNNKKKSLSYADCIGYIYAVQHGFVFLTGDDAFKGMSNVELVK